MERSSDAQLTTGTVCWICLCGGDNDLLRCGCACRGEGNGHGHVNCIIQLAQSKTEALHDMQGYFDNWRQCPTCKQLYQKEILLPLANASVERTWYFPWSHPERILSSLLLGHALILNKDFVEAEHMLLDLIDLMNKWKEDGSITSDFHDNVRRNALFQMALLFDSKEDYSSALAYYVKYRNMFDTRYNCVHVDLTILAIKHKMGYYQDPEKVLECARQAAAAYRDEADRANLAVTLSFSLSVILSLKKMLFCSLLCDDWLEEALCELSKSVLRVSRQVLGPEHETTKVLEVSCSEIRSTLDKRRIGIIVYFIVSLVFICCMLPYLCRSVESLANSIDDDALAFLACVYGWGDCK
jgi:hypothetical protein